MNVLQFLAEGLEMGTKYQDSEINTYNYMNILKI
jgi:hypothetical protein